MPAAPPSAAEVEARSSAREAGLRYVTDDRPGLGRVRAPDGTFTIVSLDQAPVADEATLARVRKLAIPPAWTDVWICADARGHLQATGRDAKGRKQYRYHPRWRLVRDAVKYDRLVAFGETLPRIRERAEADLRRRDLSREKVLGLVVRLLETTRIRIGNDEYARANKSFGLTTLRDSHARDEDKTTLRLEFHGKSGKRHSIHVTEARLARAIRRCREIPGQELFQYYDEQGERSAVDSGDVNSYLQEISGEAFTAKDFRTWAGTTLALRALCDCEPARSEADAKRQVSAAITEVAQALGNTPAVCRKAYVHPAVIDAYASGALGPDALGQHPAPDGPFDLSPEEQCVLALLRSLRDAAENEARQEAA